MLEGRGREEEEEEEDNAHRGGRKDGSKQATSGWKTVGRRRNISASFVEANDFLSLPPPAKEDGALNEGGKRGGKCVYLARRVIPV